MTMESDHSYFYASDREDHPLLNSEREGLLSDGLASGRSHGLTSQRSNGLASESHKRRLLSLTGFIRRKCRMPGLIKRMKDKGKGVLPSRGAVVLHHALLRRASRWIWRVRARLRCWFTCRRRRRRRRPRRSHVNLHPPLKVPQRSPSDLLARLHGKGGHEKGTVPKGFVPVYVGEEHQRFLIPIPFLNHPLFEGFLAAAEREFGFQQSGALFIPCRVHDFEEVGLKGALPSPMTLKRLA